MYDTVEIVELEHSKQQSNMNKDIVFGVCEPHSMFVRSEKRYLNI